MRLVVAGRGPDAERLRGLAGATGLGERILFLGDVDDAEKPYLVAGCAAYVLPSKPRPEFVETFGIALVEKMLPGGGTVITTDVGGIPEAVGDTALIVPPGEPTAITAALDRVRSLPLTAGLAAGHPHVVAAGPPRNPGGTRGGDRPPADTRRPVPVGTGLRARRW